MRSAFLSACLAGSGSERRIRREYLPSTVWHGKVPLPNGAEGFGLGTVLPHRAIALLFDALNTAAGGEGLRHRVLSSCFSPSPEP